MDFIDCPPLVKEGGSKSGCGLLLHNVNSSLVGLLDAKSLAHVSNVFRALGQVFLSARPFDESLLLLCSLISDENVLVIVC